jgi:hypothetical protein
MKVVVRNVSERKLTGLSLEVKSSACSGAVTPTRLAELIPGDRSTFAVELARRGKQQPQRYPLLLTLRAGGLPVAAGLDLLVDLSPPLDRGWIDVGQVTLIARDDGRKAYYLLAGAPLLLLVGWILYRVSRPKAKKQG